MAVTGAEDEGEGHTSLCKLSHAELELKAFNN